jgi:tetratricopeptide (TPR) repeat protein
MLSESIRASEEAVRLRPESFDDYGRLGHALQQEGKYDEAIAAYQKSLELNPKQSTAHVNLGVVYMDKGKLDDAFESFRAADEIAPNDPTTHYNLGELYFRMGRQQESLRELQILRTLNPQFADELEAFIKVGPLELDHLKRTEMRPGQTLPIEYRII